MMTTGEVIRALKPFFPNTDELKLAVNAWRRERGSKNWATAAQELLTHLSQRKEQNHGS